MGIVYSGVVDAPRPDVFAWHERRGAIERLLPPRQPIKVVSEAASLADGGGVLALPGGLRWTAQHQPAAYDPSAFFANALASDVLRSVPAGLIGSWRHEHCFGVVDAASSRVTGRVGTPAGYGGRSAADVSMTASTARRRTCQSSVVTRARPPAGHRCGDRSIGLIGTALAAFSSTGGYRVIRLVSRQPPREGRGIPVGCGDPPDARHRCVDAVVHQNVVVGWEAATSTGDGRRTASGQRAHRLCRPRAAQLYGRCGRCSLPVSAVVWAAAGIGCRGSTSSI